MPGPTLLRVDDLSKTYGLRDFATFLGMRPRHTTRALDAVSFELAEGQVTALLGPNGAGKTTLINIVCDLVRADLGAVTVAGLPVPGQGRAALRRIGYVTTNDRSFFWRLSGRRNLEFFAALQGYSIAESRRRAAAMLERFRLTADADRPFHGYSAGMKKRLGLARAFLHDPAVLLLDEPTSGLDALSMEELLELVRHEMQSARKTVLWATHRAEEVEKLCNRVIVLIEGRLHFNGGADEFIRISRRHQRFTIEVLPPSEGGSRFPELLETLELALGARKTDGVLEVTGAGDEKRLSSVLSAMLAADGRIRQVRREPEPLHKVFSHLKVQPAP